MAKRLSCPRCRAEGEYDVPPIEAAAPLREVGCRACGHRFSYGFAPEYVTTPNPELAELGKTHPADAPYDGPSAIAAAREALMRHVTRHAEYHDRDRDVLLLYLVDMVDRLDQDLTAIKRTLDVLAKRSLR
jgi:hypothetical protein